MSVDDFSPERIKRILTLSQAACLWTGLPFSVLQSCLDLGDDGIYCPDHPKLNHAFEVLVEATDTLELQGGCDEEGRPWPVSERQVIRDD